MKRALYLIILLLAGTSGVWAQNGPYALFGDSTSLLTTSYGISHASGNAKVIVAYGKVTYTDSIGHILFTRNLKPWENLRWLSVDPLADQFPSWSPYNFVYNNPIRMIDPTGLAPKDFVENAQGEIYWDENATSQETTKQGETYLGKNVIVATHNRDETGNEQINSARFDLYLEKNKQCTSATIMGNTVPADITKYGTLAEGLYSARFQGRATYLKKGIDDLAVIINEGKDLPTVSGNPNKSNSDMLSEVFLHAGNYANPSLFTRDESPISAGCQTTGCGDGTRPLHNAFMENVGRDFNGSYYLRAPK